MEGVPKMIMLRTSLKTTPEKTDFSRKIRWQIREHFNEDPNAYSNEIKELETLRASACHPPHDFSGCALMKKYYCQLLFLQNRFTFEETGRDEIYFTWNDMYTGMAYSTTDIKHEMACVLFNIGALHVNLGSMDSRQTAEGMKISCSHFQCAAWAFQQINEKYPQPRETDLCHELVKYLSIISLAQAQECILEKSIMDGRKPGIVAKVAAQIVDYYKSALKVLEQGNNHPDGNAVVEVAGSKIYKAWKKYAEFKTSFHQCVSLLYMGLHSEEMQKMGERLAYYQASMDKLTEATKLAKKIEHKAENIHDAISFVHDVVGGFLKAAEKENEFVYHEKVPDRNTLPEIKGASLVKGTPIDIQDPEIAGQDIFHRLVPMEAHEASSLYSEEKAKLLRKISGNVEEKDQELDLFLTSLQVDQLKVHLDPAGLPQELIDLCAAFSVESNVAQSLIEAMGNLSSVYTDVESSLAEIQQLLSEEQENERIYQSQGKRPPSMILKELSLEAGRYSEAHAKAADSNMLLHKAINSHLGNLRTLSLPLTEIQAQLPSIQVMESTKDQASIKELQRLLDKVEEMRKQRQMLYTQLREALQADDITKLATHQTDLETLFTQELAKHQRLTSLIEQNLSAQEKILVALTEANARYADTRRSTAEIQQRRAAAVAALLASAEAYPDLTAKCQKGLEFYRKMDMNVTKLLQRLRSVCRVQQEEREQQEAARDRNRSGHVIHSTKHENTDPVDVQGGPKLKDFLHLMKKDRTGAESSFLPTASSGVLSGGAEAVAPFSYPYQRPTPLGAEQSDPHSQSPFVADGSSQYYHHPSPADGFSSSGPSYSGFSAEKPSPFPSSSTSTPSRAHSSYPPLNPHAPPVTSIESATSVYPNPVMHSSQPPHQQPQLTVGYMGQFSGSNLQSVPPYGSVAPNQQMAYQNFPTATSYYGPVSSAGSTAPYASTSAPSLSQQTYPLMSNVGQQMGNLASTTNTVGSGTTSTQYTQAFPAVDYFGNHQMNGGAFPPSSYDPRLVAANAVPNQQQPFPTSTAGPSFTPITPATATSTTSQPQAYPGVASPAPVHQFNNQQPQNPYSYPSGSMYGFPPTSTTNVVAPVHQYPYGYASSNVNAGSSGSYQHGTTGTNNTAPSQSTGHQPGLMTQSASGMNQYQHYPYYPNAADPAAYYPSGSYYTDHTQTAQILQPTPLAPTPVAVSTGTTAPMVGGGPATNIPPTVPIVEQVSSNLELLSLLDVSVPIAPAPGALLEPQPRETPPGGNTHGTTTLTNSFTKTAMMDSSKTTSSESAKPSSITSPFESALPIEKAVEMKILNTQLSVPNKDPLADSESTSKLVGEVEKLAKLVDGLTRKSLNGPTSLDTRWKEVVELQERESTRHSISVARCYPMKNRLPDVLPYDHNRVELPTTKDDYINASIVPALSSVAPAFIATQTPLPCTQQDFWTMIWQQSVEIVVCLLSDNEIPKPNASTNAIYWPIEKGKDVVSGPWTVTLQSSNVRPYCHERILGLTKNGESKQRVLIHLQFTAWPGSSFPASPSQFLQLVSEVFHFWQQQRSKSHPIVVHCLAGAGRTGLFCLLCTALSDLTAGHGLIDVVRVAATLCQHRRNMFRDREHLLFAYQALLYHAQDLLMKRGILSGTSSLQGSPMRKHHPSHDFVQTPSPTHSITSATSVLEAAAEVLKVEAVAVEPQATDEQEPSPQTESKKSNLGALAILDPANFTLEGGQMPRHRVTKESFKNSSQLGTVTDPSDPLSQLDPLWSLAK